MLAAGHLGPLTTRQREYVDHILASSRTMQGLVSDVLDLSRMDAGRLELTRAPVAVGELLAELASTVAPAAERSGVSIGVEADPGLGVDADRRALRSEGHTSELPSLKSISYDVFVLKK